MPRYTRGEPHEVPTCFTPPTCAMFLLCENDADGVADTGLFVLGADGWVATCQRCADKLGYDLIPWNQMRLEAE